MKQGQGYVNDRHPQSALREVRDDLTSRPALVGMGATGVLLGVSGPFGTQDVLPMLPRIVYWLIIVVTTYSIGVLISTICDKALRARALWFRLTVSTLAIGLAVSTFLTAVNFATFGQSAVPLDIADTIQFVAIVTLIAAVIVGSGYLLSAGTGAPSDAAVTGPTAGSPAILDRLPFAKRGALVSLSVSDHYVEAVTAKGTELLLMRLSDAIGETRPVAGLQVHRSHWVALDQIAAAKRVGDRAILTLQDGREIPVSRANLPAVKAAGILV